MNKSSRISGLHKMTIQERIKIIQDFAQLEDEDVQRLGKSGSLDLETADRMIENVIGTFELPLGVVTNMIVNQREVLVPLAVEEASVVAALSNAAKMARSGGGFFTSSTPPVMIGQIQIAGVSDPFATKMQILEHRQEIIDLANQQDPLLVEKGGGCRDVEVRVLDSAQGPMVISHILVDTQDAMGANAVNTMAEALAPFFEELSQGRVFLRILSNLADRRLVRARCLVKKDAIPPGPEVIDGILNAWAFADADPYRAATHNKGIMNGISALTVSTGNDFRAIESGAHTYAARSGQYKPLTHWEKDRDGNLQGSIELPMALGLIGGATAVHPVAKTVVKTLGVKIAIELGEIAAAVGLGQNLAALRVLAAEGVQRGHMSLHAKNIAAMAGAVGSEVEEVSKILVKEKKVRMDRALEILNTLRTEQP